MAVEETGMKTEVLITYCTRSGSTAEVAEAIGKTVRDAGLPVKVKAIGEVESIAAGTEVVLGTALFSGFDYYRRFHDALSRSPNVTDINEARRARRNEYAAHDNRKVM